MGQSRKRFSQNTPKCFIMLPVKRKLVSVHGCSSFLSHFNMGFRSHRTLIKGWKTLVTGLGQYMQDFNEVKYTFMSLQLINRDVKIISVQAGSIRGAAEPKGAFSDGNHGLCFPLTCIKEESGTSMSSIGMDSGY